VELLGRGTEVGQDRPEVDLGGWPPGTRCLGEEVVQVALAGRGAPQQETAAAERAEHRLGDAGGEMGGDHGIEGVAAVGENLAGRRRGSRVAGRHDPFRHRSAAVSLTSTIRLQRARQVREFAAKKRRIHAPYLHCNAGYGRL
jgi:hypothetical protein